MIFLIIIASLIDNKKPRLSEVASRRDSTLEPFGSGIDTG